MFEGQLWQAYLSDSDDGQASGSRKALPSFPSLPVPPTSSSLNQLAGKSFTSPCGNMTAKYLDRLTREGCVDDNGNLKDALLLGIKLDLEAEIHLTARVRRYYDRDLLSL